MARWSRTLAGAVGLVCCGIAAGCCAVIDVPFVDDETDELKEFVRHNPPRQWWKQLRNEDGTFSGKLSGTKVRHQDGRVEKDPPTYKGLSPLELTLGYHRLSLLCETEEIAERLVAASGRKVRLEGHVTSAPVPGRVNGTGQMGFTGALPDHYVTFLVVTEIVSID